jgi:uncharacterized membrane protein (DUF485 family)
MPGLNHESIPSTGRQEPPAPRTARYGLVLFAAYLALYGGFVVLNAFAPSLMESTPLGGINLAVGYGLGLIVAALGLALVYAWVCRRRKDEG